MFSYVSGTFQFEKRSSNLNHKLPGSAKSPRPELRNVLNRCGPTAGINEGGNYVTEEHSARESVGPCKADEVEGQGGPPRDSF